MHLFSPLTFLSVVISSCLFSKGSFFLFNLPIRHETSTISIRTLVPWLNNSSTITNIGYKLSFCDGKGLDYTNFRKKLSAFGESPGNILFLKYLLSKNLLTVPEIPACS